jgi:hypothetical protein
MNTFEIQNPNRRIPKEARRPNPETGLGGTAAKMRADEPPHGASSGFGIRIYSGLGFRHSDFILN